VELQLFAPTTEILGTVTTEVPALSLNVTPFAPATQTERISAIPALSIGATLFAPATQITAVGTTQVDLPALDVTLSLPPPSTAIVLRLAALPSLDLQLALHPPAVVLPGESDTVAPGGFMLNMGRMMNRG